MQRLYVLKNNEPHPEDRRTEVLITDAHPAFVDLVLDLGGSDFRVVLTAESPQVDPAEVGIEVTLPKFIADCSWSPDEVLRRLETRASVSADQKPYREHDLRVLQDMLFDVRGPTSSRCVAAAGAIEKYLRDCARPSGASS